MTDDRKQQELTDSQQRTATRIALVTFVLMMVVALVTLFFVANADKTPIDNYMMPMVALSAGYSYYLARKGEHARGIYFLLGSIVVVSVIYPLAVNNVGWQTAIGMLLITTSITNSTLPERIAGRISAAAFLFAIIIIVIELFAPGVIDFPVTTSSIVITGILSIVYLGLILYRFRQFALRTKLIIAFILLSVVSVGAAAFIINRSILIQLTDRVEQQLAGVADLTATSISAELTTQINLIRALSLNSTLEAELVARNTTGHVEELLRLDQQWREADKAGNDSDPLVQSVLEHTISKELLEFRNRFPAHVEVFLTDIYGANVAATNRTSDYYQADEEWWQAAYNNGKGAAFISQPIFDESSQTLSIQMAVPVFETRTGAILGILRTNVDLNLFVSAFESGRLGQTGRTEIYLQDGTELEIQKEANGEFILKIEKAPEDFVIALRQNETIMHAFHDGQPVLVGQALLKSNTDSPEISTALQLLGWRVITLQDRTEALQIVSDVSRNAQLVGLGALVISGLMAIGMAQFLTRPIARLRQAAEEVSAGNLQVHATVESPDEIGTLAESFNRMTGQLRESLGSLERRVAERTADLEMARLLTEMRAQELHSISEISRVISSERRLEILLPLIARLVSDKFGFYHVGIFITEDTHQFAVLQAANSEGGRRMLERGHRLEVGQTGIVGSVADTGKPRIALDVGADPVFFNNPDLPETRSEMALPLNARGITIGVLDAQSTNPGAFTENDANTLSILADQVAIAIENARLFGETQRARDEAEALYKQYIRQEWIAFSRQESRVGYHQAAIGGKPLETAVESDEIRAALQKGEVVAVDANNTKSYPSIAVPVKLRGQVIGVLNIKAPTKNRKWNPDEINFAQIISDRLALALENARLLQESQRRAAKEQKIGEVTAKIGTSINIRNVLQTAVEELGRALPGSEVVIQFDQNESKKG